MSDWSSDMCSSDLPGRDLLRVEVVAMRRPSRVRNPGCRRGQARLSSGRSRHRGDRLPEQRQSWCVRSTRPGLELSLGHDRSEEHTSELQSLMRISYAVFCLQKKKPNTEKHTQ